MKNKIKKTKLEEKEIFASNTSIEKLVNYYSRKPYDFEILCSKFLIVLVIFVN